MVSDCIQWVIIYKDHCYFDAQIVLDLTSRIPFKLAFVSFQLVPILVF